MTSSIEILLGEGISSVKFGMTKSQVQKVLGAPDETEVYQFSEDEQDLTEAWHYDEHGFSLSFDQENDWLLGSIAVSQTPCMLSNVDVMGMDKTALLAVLEDMAFGEVEIESGFEVEEETDMEVIFSPDENIFFFLEEEQVSEVKWSPRWTETEILDWPLEVEN